MNKIKIGIGCIGSGVGQSIINSIRLSNLPIETVGFGTNPYAYGAYECNSYDNTPSIYDDEYINEIINLYHNYKLDLYIPGLDDEVLIFAKNEDLLVKEKIRAIYSRLPLVALCRDKENMNLKLRKFNNLLLRSYSPTSLKLALKNKEVSFPLIAKPRDGSGSKGIKILLGLDDITNLDSSYFIQEIAIPIKNDDNYIYFMKELANHNNAQVAEISIQLVYGLTGNLLGKAATYNSLRDGVPIEVLPYDNDHLWKLIAPISKHFITLGLRGPLNIQARITQSDLKIFEMNPRFTGITGMRALLGFNEVEACIKEWMGINKKDISICMSNKKFGMRQYADKVIPISKNEQILSQYSKLKKTKKVNKKVVLITGANGYLGQQILSQLSNYPEFESWGLSYKTLPVLKRDEYIKSGIKYIFDIEDLDNGFVPLGRVDILLHLGFARPYRKERDIANSLDFTHKLFTLAAMHQIQTIINISSQSVYGMNPKIGLNEQDVVQPHTVYAQAKYSTEVFLLSLKRLFPHIRTTSLRLAAMGAGQPGLRDSDDFMAILVKQILQGKSVQLVNAKQQISRIDVRDVANALIKMLLNEQTQWPNVMNLGSSCSYSLEEIAKNMIKISEDYIGKVNIKIITDNKPVTRPMVLDSSLFFNTYNWKPKFSINQTIASYFDYYGKTKHAWKD